MEVTIQRTVAGTRPFTLNDVYPDHTVKQIKQMIQNRTGISVACQTLKFGDTIMKDDHCIGRRDYCAYPGNSVNLKLLERQRNGYVEIRLIVNSHEIMQDFPLINEIRRSNTTVVDLKEFVRCRYNLLVLSTDDIHLFLKKNEMMNHQALNDFDISDGCRIKVLLT